MLLTQDVVLDDPKLWDQEWATDWKVITTIFGKIDEIEIAFAQLHVSIHRQFTQRQLILALQKYAYSLSKIIEAKYRDS